MKVVEKTQDRLVAKGVSAPWVRLVGMLFALLPAGGILTHGPSWALDCEREAGQIDCRLETEGLIASREGTELPGLTGATLESEVGSYSVWLLQGEERFRLPKDAGSDLAPREALTGRINQFVEGQEETLHLEETHGWGDVIPLALFSCFGLAIWILYRRPVLILDRQAGQATAERRNLIRTTSRRTWPLAQIVDCELDSRMASDRYTVKLVLASGERVEFGAMSRGIALPNMLVAQVQEFLRG